jgi:hypothetical protein
MARHKTLLTHADRRERRERILAEIVAGKGISYLCKKYGLSVATISEVARANGHYFEYTPPSHVHPFIVLRKLLGGQNAASIAREHGVSRERIRQIKNEAVAAGFKIGKAKR